MSRSTRWRALLAAVLPAAVAAIALPSAAQAASVSGSQSSIQVFDRGMLVGGHPFEDNDVENVTGGSGDDSIKSMSAFSTLFGGEGNDHLVGGFGPDRLIGGPDLDVLDGGSEIDVIDSRDGTVEHVDCGSGADTLTRDSFDGFRSCETLKLGVLRLATDAVKAEAGETARLRLSWRHPRAWRELRQVELRLVADGVAVGRIVIRPGRERIAAKGRVGLVRRGTRLEADGKDVSARLAVRLDRSLAGERLKIEVEATDRRGRRQLERNGGTIEVRS